MAALTPGQLIRGFVCHAVILYLDILIALNATDRALHIMNVATDLPNLVLVETSLLKQPIDRRRDDEVILDLRKTNDVLYEVVVLAGNELVQSFLSTLEEAPEEFGIAK